MKNNIPTIAKIIRLVAEVVLLGFVFFNAHWSVFAVLVLMTVAIEMMASVIQLQMHYIKAMRQLHKEDKSNFNEFIATINQQAVAFKREITTCKECEIHGQHGIRPGSVHNRAARNCLMYEPNKTTL